MKEKILKAIRAKLYLWIIQKDREELKERAHKQGYELGYAQAKQEYDQAKLKLEQAEKDWLVDPFDVFTVTKSGLIFLGNEQVTDTELQQLKEEARTVRNFRLWRVLQNTLKQKAIEKSVLKSENWEQVLAGKMMVHSLGVFESVVNVLVNYKKYN